MCFVHRRSEKCVLTPEGDGEGGGGVDSGVATDGGSSTTSSSSTSSHPGRQSPTHIPHMTPAHTQVKLSVYPH